MIEYAKNEDIYISMCTNGLSLDAQNVVNSGVDSIAFAIGGLT